MHCFFVFFHIVVLLSSQFVKAAIDKNVSSSETSSTKPTMPPNPTIGGKPSNPGAILHIAKRFIVSNVQQACRDAEKKKPEGRAVSGISMKLSNGELVFSDLQLVSLAIPLALSNVFPPNRLCWCAEQGRLSAAASWKFYPSSNSSDDVQYSGSLYVPPSAFAAHVNSTLGRTSENQPAITDIDCQIRLNVTKMFFSSPTPDGQTFIAAVEPNATLLIKEELESYVCDTVSTVLRLALNKFLTTFQTKITLWEDPDIVLDYSLIADPFIDPVDYSINGFLKGAITVNNAPVPFFPHTMASIDNDTNPIIAVRFSDFMLNSLLYSAYQSNLLTMTVNHDFSKKVAEQLRLECDDDELCVGSVFQTKDFSSEMFGELTATATRPPSAIFLDSGAFMQIYGWVSVDVRSFNSPRVKVNRMSCPFALLAELKPFVVTQKTQVFVALEAKVTELRLFGSLPAPRYRLVPLLVPILEEVMNMSLRRGVPAPSFSNISVFVPREPVLSLYNRTLVLYR